MLDIAPGNEEAHLDLARLYEERHDRANAVKMYQSLLRCAPTMPRRCIIWRASMTARAIQAGSRLFVPFGRRRIPNMPMPGISWGVSRAGNDLNAAAAH